MKIYNKFKKFICYTLLLVVLSLTCSGCSNSKEESSQPESSSSQSESSSSQSSSSKENSSSTGNFALKYKDYEMSLDEYKMLMFCVITELSEENQSSIKKDNLTLEEFVRSGSFEGQPTADWIKQNSVDCAKAALIARKKLKRAGKDLSPESKKSINSYVEQTFSSLSQTCNISLNGIKDTAQDIMRLEILDKGKIGVSNAEADEVTVNDKVVDEIDVVDLAKRAEECIKGGTTLIDKKILQQKTI